MVPGEGRGARADALVQGLFAQVSAPGPDRHDDVDGVVPGEHAHVAQAHEGQGPDVARGHGVARQGLHDGRFQLLLGVGQIHLHHPAGADHAVHVLVQAEDAGPLAGEFVGADALEHAHPVVQGVGQDVDVGLFPGNEFPVEPDVFGFLDHAVLLALAAAPGIQGAVAAESWKVKENLPAGQDVRRRVPDSLRSWLALRKMRSGHILSTNSLRSRASR